MDHDRKQLDFGAWARHGSHVWCTFVRGVEDCWEKELGVEYSYSILEVGSVYCSAHYCNPEVSCICYVPRAKSPYDIFIKEHSSMN